jgi:hypothetical protein
MWFSMFCRALSKEALPVLFHFFLHDVLFNDY